MGTQLPLPESGTAPSPPIFGAYQLRPNGCMDQDATWYGARPRPRRLRVRGDATWHEGRPQPRRLCVRWGPSPLRAKGVEPPSQFSAHFYCGQTAGCIKMPLGTEVGLRPGDFGLDGDPAPSHKGGGGRGQSPPIFGPWLLWLNGWMHQDASWYGGRPRPTRHCV